MSVTIILTTYNDSHFLTTAIPSCLNQSMENEILIVDDCSAKTDESASELISRHKFKVIRHDKNMGLSAARNTGILNAKHEWVIPLDADDWFYPDTIRTLYDNREGFDIVTGNCTDSGNVYAPAISKGPLSKEVFKRENPVICSSLFNRKIWTRAGGYMVRNGPHYEDWNFWARCFAKGARFRHVPINVYNHTSRPDSMLRTLHPNREFYVKLATEGVFN